MFETTYSYSYGCFAARLYVSAPNKVIANVTGKHSQRNSIALENSDVKYLKIDESIILYLPTGLESYFPKLQTFRMEHAKLREIHQKDLRGFEELERLYLEGNDIQVLEKELFKFNPSLRSIILKHNHLKHIDEKVFEELVQLEFLSLAANPCMPPNFMEIRNIRTIAFIAKENCKPRADGSVNWKANDDEEVEECESSGGRFVAASVALNLVFLVGGIVFVIRKKKVTVESVRERIFYGRF